MPDSPVYRPHDEAPAIGTFRTALPSAAWAGLETRAFEYVSRGDFVPGLIYLPETLRAGPSPLVLLVHGTAESAESESLGFAADWVHRGMAVATIDLPLHGRRASPKLSERLFQGIGDLTRGNGIDADTHALVEEFARQSTSDLIRGLDVLCALPEIDAERVGIVGLGVGATVSAYLIAHDTRPRACVFAGGIGRFEDAELDPATRLAARTTTDTCPILVLAIASDPAVPPGAAHAFFEDAPEPKDFAEISGRAEKSSGIPKAASQQAADFLDKHLMSSPTSPPRMS